MFQEPTYTTCILTRPMLGSDEPSVFGILSSPKPLSRSEWIAVQLNIEETFADDESGESLAQIVCACYPEFRFQRAYRDTAVRHIDTNKAYGLA